MIATVVLAAGASRRYGGDKLAAIVGDRTLLDWTLDYVVAATPAAACRLAVNSDSPPCDRVPVVVIGDAAAGLSYTLAGVLRSLDAGVMGAAVLLGDDPLAAAALALVLTAARADPARPVAVRRLQRTPHPVYLPRSLWPASGGDHGFGLARLLDASTRWIDAPDLPPSIDVDTPADLLRLARFLGDVAALSRSGDQRE